MYFRLNTIPKTKRQPYIHKHFGVWCMLEIVNGVCWR